MCPNKMMDVFHRDYKVLVECDEEITTSDPGEGSGSLFRREELQSKSKD